VSKKGKRKSVWANPLPPGYRFIVVVVDFEHRVIEYDGRTVEVPPEYPRFTFPILTREG